MKKLYRVKINTEIFVLADNKEKGVDEAIANIWDEVDEEDCHIKEVNIFSDISPKWENKCPCGNDSDKTCEEVFQDIKRNRLKNKRIVEEQEKYYDRF